ncbi:uncharacterized protein BYT42DRAFT_609582 [Radiomyces spectabilis]|uniref:uncharacterized protein n=1 Tax=Radiomyces spectabilis TaxID=64574 RepID=UPI00221FAC64|nr:uncharacterized protein BYT42DRAFT_609582 [Radiomyces spectabilis]KAI8393816.1 hypothetical protein BYT42DRAFT_609582 [Radiomyces spectabilis]
MLSATLTEKVLSRLKDWKLGIRPSGELADFPCFVQTDIPRITPLIEDQSCAWIVTQSAWTANLVSCGVLWTMNNDSTMRAFSECQMMFHPRLSDPHHKVVHLLHFDTHAWFPINRILRPTVKCQSAIESALANLPDQEETWKALCRVWHEFGFFWPQKIVLGQRVHIKVPYQLTSEKERLYRLKIAKDEAFIEFQRQKGKLEMNKEKPLKEGPKDDALLQHASTTWTIIKRDDILPIHEFLSTKLRDQIVQVIYQRFHRIPLQYPFKLRNLHTTGYLSWRLNTKKKAKQAPSDTDQFLFGSLPLESMRPTQSQYLWRFTFDASQRVPSFINLDAATYQSHYLRCGTRIYLSPACDTPCYLRRHDSSVMLDNTSPISHILPSHRMILTRLPLPKDADRSNTASRVRAVSLVSTDGLEHNSSYDISQDWTIEMPGLGLGRDDDASTDERLNIDIQIGRLKPIIDGDIIALRQLLYLCSVANIGNGHRHGWETNSLSPTAWNPEPSQSPRQKNINPNDVHHPVLAKEHALVSSPTEQCWVIELATAADLERHPFYAPTSSKEIDLHASISGNTSTNDVNDPNLSNVRTLISMAYPRLKAAASVESLRPSVKSVRKVQSMDSILTTPYASLSIDNMFTPNNLSMSESTAQESLTDMKSKQPPVIATTTPLPASVIGRPAPVDVSPVIKFDVNDMDVVANARAQPYLKFYAAQQNTMTWSQLVRNASLTKLRRLVHPKSGANHKIKR